MALLGAQFVNAVSPNPVGSLQAYAGASAPTGWLLCDGGQTLITAYPELYSVLGTTYGALTNGSGGAGSTHFRVPDLRGRMPIGAGNDGSAANNVTRTRGSAGGDTRVHAHAHTRAWGTYGNGAGGVGYTRLGSYDGQLASDTTGEGTGENMPPFLVTNYIIKAVPDAPRSGLAYGSTPPIVTQLPANPQFGDVVTYIADAANGVAWNLQYDASGTYPWKFVGGSALASLVLGEQGLGVTVNTFIDLGTVGPQITTPLSGDYTVEWGANAVLNAGVSTVAGMGVKFGSASAPADTNPGTKWVAHIGQPTTSGGAIRSAISNKDVALGVSASTLIKAQYRHNNGNIASFGYRSLSITPIRVSA